MERQAFEKELGKYSIARLADFYRPRLKRQETKTAAPRLTLGDKGEKEKFKLVDESQQNVGFWDLMEKAAKEILSPEETEKFLAAVRKNYKDVPDLINLEDLNYAASILEDVK
mmetsp:Transcript_7921/g.8669  ORF Transcript_7921/g.8669 Transcript_7921/m.8669 type:complete len:113 (-) Transcript_7921:41-379(-)|eukprot:gene6378-6872_t